MFTFHTTVRLPDTDAAGILFFGKYFRLAHDTYESFMKSIGFGLDYIIREADFLVLIAHAEADYKTPLQLGETVTVVLEVKNVGQTSFVLSYSLKDAQNNIAASLKTVHVTVDKKSGNKLPLPPELREKLTRIR
ncbi:MAG: acyl-CoA thioesterase [Candidatus Zixiibacteriota bacterium]